ncbi:MAG: right-handed parallel beta-helix repeat-containing protein [Verrucomicrobiota bacterium]
MKLLFLTASFFWVLASMLPAGLTLRSLGAKGDGMTDDRAAIEAALKQSSGQPVDGEGLTYAVHGSIHVRVAVDLSNATLLQTMGGVDTTKFIRSTQNTTAPTVVPPASLTQMVNGVPLLRYDAVATYAEDPLVTGADLEAIRAMLNIRTLFIYGTDNQPVPVKLTRVKILRGNHPEAGMHSNSAGLYLVNAGPVTLKEIEITGDGKGAGLYLNRCAKVRMDGLNIHDIHWAPYAGDVTFSSEVLARDFGWNNSPIYDFDERAGRFIRVRVQEQLTGMTIGNSEDVEVIHSRIERIGTHIDGKFLPWQADGVTVGGVKGLVMRDCVITNTWEGIDLTGKGVDGFVQENIRISDSFAYGFKYAHPQKNGKVINCTSERAGFRSFTIGSESENIEFINCAALETGVQGYWVRPGRPSNGIAGFELGFGDGLSPRNITLKDCRAENVQFPQAMEFGFSTSDRVRNPELNIRLINPKTVGATIRAIDGFNAE